MTEIEETIRNLLARTSPLDSETMPDIVKPPKKGKTVHIDQPAGMNAPEATAQALVDTPLQSGMTISHYLDKAFDTESRELTTEVSRQAASVNAGDLRNVERLLVSQAYSLDAIYNQYARQSAMNQYSEWKEIYLKMALQAQRHCVKTIEALAALKNPKSVAFVGQTNIAQHQQVLNRELPSHD